MKELFSLARMTTLAALRHHPGVEIDTSLLAWPSHAHPGGAIIAQL
jgi:hypothetical protein